MKEFLLLISIPFLLLTGCASKDLVPRHDVAISHDLERIAYNVSGEGKTALVFIHGWSCDARYWQKQVPAFAGDYQVVALDLAGHGHSSAERLACTMESFADDVRAVIDKEHIERAVLVGHSMGGAVVAEAARLMPKKVIGIVGIDTLQNVGERHPQKFIDDMVAPFDADFTNATRNFVAGMFPQGADPRLVRWVCEDMSSAPKTVALSAFRNYLQQYVNGEAARVFNDIRIPVVSINARLWPTEPEENRKHIADYHLYYIDGTGHFPMLEKPEEFNALLRKAVQSVEAKWDDAETQP